MSSKRRVRKKSCTGKKVYRTETEARQAAPKASRAYKSLLLPYHCKFGDHYHVGHPPARARQGYRAKKGLQNHPLQRKQVSGRVVS